MMLVFGDRLCWLIVGSLFLDDLPFGGCRRIVYKTIVFVPEIRAATSLFVRVFGFAREKSHKPCALIIVTAAKLSESFGAARLSTDGRSCCRTRGLVPSVCVCFFLDWTERQLVSNLLRPRKTCSEAANCICNTNESHRTCSPSVCHCCGARQQKLREKMRGVWVDKTPLN